jgi:uncharacterized protein (TIGR02996 family)
MSDEAGLLATIHSHPNDDTPRLVYADWLDEQGGEGNAARAEYIRLEIEIARTPVERTIPPEVKEKHERSQALFVKHHREWFPAFYGRPNLLNGARATVRLRRGFPYYVYAHNPSRIVAIGEKLFPLAPLTDLILNNIDSSCLKSLLQKPWLSHLTYFQLAGYDRPPTDWGPVADCPYLAGLEELVFCAGAIDSTGAARIAAANPCPKLRRFSLGAHVTDEPLARLFAGPAFTGLEELRVSGRHDTFGLPGVQAVASSPVLAGLKAFDLPWQIFPGILPALTRATFWTGLEELKLLRCGLTNEDLAEMVRQPPPLRILELDDNKITSAGASLLAGSPLLATLTNLDLGRNAIGDGGITALVTTPNARNLRVLEVPTCKFGLAGITAVAESPHLENLRELVVHSNDIDLKGWRVLAGSPHLGGLTRLSVSGCTGAARKALKDRFGAAVSF